MNEMQTHSRQLQLLPVTLPTWVMLFSFQVSGGHGTDGQTRDDANSTMHRRRGGPHNIDIHNSI